VAESLPLQASELAQFTFNAIEASFISATEKQRLQELTQTYLDQH